MSTDKKQRPQDEPKAKPGLAEEERRRKQAIAAGLAGAAAVGTGAGAVVASGEILDRRDDSDDGQTPGSQPDDSISLDVFDSLAEEADGPDAAGSRVTTVTTPRAGREGDEGGVESGSSDIATTPVASGSGSAPAPPAVNVAPQQQIPQAPSVPGPQSSSSAPQPAPMQPVQSAAPVSPVAQNPAGTGTGAGDVIIAGSVQADGPVVDASIGAPPVMPAPVEADPVASEPPADSSASAPSSSVDTSSSGQSDMAAAPDQGVDQSTSVDSVGSSDDSSNSSQSVPGYGQQPVDSGAHDEHEQEQDAYPPIYGEQDNGQEQDDAQPPPDYDQDPDYGYPRVIAYNAAHGVVRVAINDEGFILEYHEDGAVYRIDEHGNQHAWSFVPEQAVKLLDVDHHGNARFERADGTIYELDTHGNYEIIDDAVADDDQYEEEPPEDDYVRYYLDEDHPHPADVYDQPDSAAQYNGVLTQTYGGGAAVVTTLPDGDQIIIWFVTDDDGNLVTGQADSPVVDLRVRVDAGGEYTVQVFPVDYFDDRIVDITLEGYEDYPDPAELDIYHEVRLDGNEIRILYGDGSTKTIDRTDGTVTITYPDGTIIQENAAGVDTLIQAGDGTYQPPVDDDPTYQAEWAANYDGNPAFEHPYDLYGAPESTTINAEGNYVYRFNQGMAMVERDADGNETITWFSHPAGGGYVTYQAVVTYDGDGYTTTTTISPLPPDGILPNAGFVNVEGALYQDPWQEYGEAEMEEAITDESVTQTWQTDDGPVTKTWYRDGSHRTEITYADGVVVTLADGGVSYEVPDGWEPPEEQDAELDGEYEYLPAGAPEVFEYNGETYPNPEVDESFTYQYSTQAGAHYYQNEDGYTIVIKPNEDGTTTMIWGNPAANNGSWDMQMTVQADGQYAPIEAFEVEPEAPPEYEYLPEGAPEAFEYNGETYVNPETDESFTYQYSTQSGAHFFQDANGYTIVIVENADGTTTMTWGNPQANNGAWDMSMIVQPDGQYAPTEAFEVTPIAMEGFIVGTINPALFGDAEGHLPPGLPDHFVNENYPNPETDDSYVLVSSETTPTGLGTHRYADSEGNTITVATSNGQPVQIAWADSDGNQNLIVSFNAEGEWTPSLYNPDEYTPPGQSAPDAEPPTNSSAGDDPEDETGLGHGLIESPHYPHGVATDEVFTSDLPDHNLRTHVEAVGWVREEDIDYDDHTWTFTNRPVLVRNDYLEDHVWTGVGWVAKDDIEEGVDDFFFEGPGQVFVSDIQAQTAADPEDAPQVGELPTGPEFTMPETPSIVSAEEEAVPAAETASQTATSATTYPLVLDWGAGMEGGWVRVAQADGNIYEYHAGDPTTYLVTDSGVVATNTPAPSLMHVGNDGTATFQHSSGSFYFQWNTAGGQVEVAESALPFGVDEPYVEPEPEIAEAAPVDDGDETASPAESSTDATIDFTVTEDAGADTTQPDQSSGDDAANSLQPSVVPVEEEAVPIAVIEQQVVESDTEAAESDLDDDDGMP